MKVLIIHNTAHYIVMHYREFVERLLGMGYDVTVLTPCDPAWAVLEQMGVRCASLRLSRRGINPLTEIHSIIKIIRMVRKECPDILFNYSIKPVIYGSFAGRFLRVRKVYSMVTGLGYVFLGLNLRQQLLKHIVLHLYRFVLRGNDKVFFQNSQDRNTFVEAGLVTEEQAVTVNGTGIDVDAFAMKKDVGLGDDGRRPVFLMIARLLREKGVAEYAVAASIVKSRYQGARFLLLGPFDDNPSAISMDQVEQWTQEGAIEYLGETPDVRPYLERADVFVLPTYYREGTPRAILEAMAMGKPVVTSDWPGCREPVKDGDNGFLVQVRDAQDLARALERFIVEPELIGRMGVRSRERALERYDVRLVNDSIIKAMGLKYCH